MDSAGSGKFLFVPVGGAADGHRPICHPVLQSGLGARLDPGSLRQPARRPDVQTAAARRQGRLQLPAKTATEQTVRNTWNRPGPICVSMGSVQVLTGPAAVKTQQLISLLQSYQGVADH